MQTCRLTPTICRLTYLNIMRYYVLFPHTFRFLILSMRNALRDTSHSQAAH